MYMEFFEPLYDTEYEQVNAHHDNDIYEPETFSETIRNAVDTDSTVQWFLFIVLIFLTYWTGNILFSMFNSLPRPKKQKQNNSFII